MKIRSSSKNGYASLVVTISIAMTLIAMSVTTFRKSRHAQEVQKVSQVRLDYEQKERAFLRALLEIVPNTAMRCMMKDSANDANTLNWKGVFTEALKRAGASQGIDPSVITGLSMSPGLISANTGDATYSPTGMIASPDGSGNFVFPSTNTNLSNLPAGFPVPPSLSWSGSGSGNDYIYPVVGLNKTLPGQGQFTLMPYPEVQFGYQTQGQNFLAKRNWWAFTVNWGALQSGTSGVNSSSRTYVLSLYEVPSQLGLSSSGTSTGLGKFSDGSDWTNISIQGSVYARKANVLSMTSLGNISSREGISLADTGEQLGTLAERREQRATTGQFSPFSASGDSGLVSFTPINRGWDFFDFFSSTDAGNRISNTNWNTYSIGAQQCEVQFDVTQVQSSSYQLPTRVFVAAKFPNGSTYRHQCTRGSWWNTEGEGRDYQSGGYGSYWPIGSPPGNDWPVQTDALPNGRPCLTLDLEKLPAFLDYIDASDTTVNNTIWIGPNYNRSGDGQSDNTNVKKPNYPTLDSDMSLIIRKSSDLSAYPKGLTIVTPMRIYFADDFNSVPTTPPAGVTASGDWFPPVSVFAPEKRFGTETTDNGLIKVSGQIGILPSDLNVSEVKPLDLREGGSDTLNTSLISAELDQIGQVSEVPPINAMSWMTVIEAIH